MTSVSAVSALPPVPLSSGSSSSRVCSRDEISFVCFLRRVELNWPHDDVKIARDRRLADYVRHMGEMVAALEKHPQSPSKDVIKEYRAKVAFLKKVIEDAVAVHGANEDDPDAAAEDAATDGQFVTRRSSATLVSPLRPFSRPSGAGGGIGGIGGGSGAPPPVNGDPLAAEIHQRGKERRNLAEREMLLGQSDSGASSSSTAADFEDLMRVQHEAQEQTAEEMLQLTRALKEQSMAANEIIKKDIGTLEKTDELAERNAEKLAIEAERLAEHTKRSCRCWIWFIILIVSVTFIAMVMVMKVFRKRNL